MIQSGRTYLARSLSRRLWNIVVGKFRQVFGRLIDWKIGSCNPFIFPAASSLPLYLDPSGAQQPLGPLAYHV